MSKELKIIEPIIGVELETLYMEKAMYNLYFEHYMQDNSISIQVVSQEDEEGFAEPMCKATVCLPDYSHLIDVEKQVFIKDWSENEGIAEALIKSGFLSIADIEAKCGYEVAYAYNLNMEMINYAGES